jgi:hypothetical protein
MIGLLCLFLALVASPFNSKSRLEAENAVLRHQLIVLRRKVQGRVRLTNNDRWFLIQLYRWFPSILNVLTIIRPETLVRWHRAGFRCYWRWKSGSRGRRPQIETNFARRCSLHFAHNPLSSNSMEWIQFAAKPLISNESDLTLNQRVPGSSPGAPTISRHKIKRLQRDRFLNRSRKKL